MRGDEASPQEERRSRRQRSGARCQPGEGWGAAGRSPDPSSFPNLCPSTARISQGTAVPTQNVPKRPFGGCEGTCPSVPGSCCPEIAELRSWRAESRVGAPPSPLRTPGRHSTHPPGEAQPTPRDRRCWVSPAFLIYFFGHIIMLKKKKKKRKTAGRIQNNFSSDCER